MKSHSRLFYLLVMVALMALLVACGGTNEPPANAPAEETNTTDVAEEPAEEMAEEPAEEPAEEETVGDPGAEVTLRYANWNLGTEEENNLQRRMVQAYIDANPHVSVEFVDMSAEGGWEAVLTSYAAKGELPDVFMANNVPLYVQNGWLADLTEYVQDDPAWANITEALVDTGTYGGRVLGLPAAQFVMGYFVNQDLYEEANLDAPAYGFTVEEFEDAVTSLHNPSQGVLGLDEYEFMIGWYPNTQDPNLKWFSYDGEKMNYNSAPFKEGIAFAGEMKQYTWQGQTEEQLANFQSTGPWELFLNEEVGMRWDGSWAVPGIVSGANFNWDFVGIPGGNQAMVADVIVVSATAANPEEAFAFARWMTYSPEAYVTEVEIAREMGTAPKMPVSVDEESLTMYKEFVDVPGIHAALDNLDNSLVESLAKVIPGYINARWEGKPGINIGDQMDVNMAYMFANANEGQYKFEDYSAQLETFANQILSDATAQMSQ